MTAKRALVVELMSDQQLWDRLDANLHRLERRVELQVGYREGQALISQARWCARELRKRGVQLQLEV